MKTFYHLLGNTVIAAITNLTVWFALTYYVFLETKSVFATSIISGIYLVVTAASGFWLGSLVDHYKKKHVMALSSCISLVLYVVGFILYILAPEALFQDVGSPTLWIFVLLLMFGVIAGNIRNIALPTLVTLLVPEDRHDKANGMTGMATGVAFMIVSAISGFLVGWGGMYYALLLAIILMLITAIHLWMTDVDEKKIVHLDGKPKNIDISGTYRVIKVVPGLLALIFFTMFNNFLGGVFMSLMDAYGLSLVSVQVWGLLWAVLSTGFILGGVLISKWGLGKNPLRAMFLANLVIWTSSTFFTIQPSIILLSVGMFIYIVVMPYIEAGEHTVIQKVVPPERQGRVFGFAQSIEQMASPFTAFAIGPIAQFLFIPFMTTGAGVDLIGGWFGTGMARGIALVFTLTGLLGLLMTFFAMRSKAYKTLSRAYMK